MSRAILILKISSIALHMIWLVCVFKESLAEWSFISSKIEHYLERHYRSIFSTEVQNRTYCFRRFIIQIETNQN